MTRVLYADTSALARVYLPDEPDAEMLRELLLESAEAVLASELVRVELARAIKNGERSGRISNAGSALERVDADLERSIALVDFDPTAILPRARELVLGHRLGTLDAMHLAVALEESRSTSDPVVFVTRDHGQAKAARALGFSLM